MEDKSVFNLENLKVWQMSVEIATRVCKSVLPRFPKKEEFALSNQLRRSVQSISANIAEGHGRYYYQDAVRFCYIARGSLEETLSHLILAQKLGYLTDVEFLPLKTELSEISRSLNGYISYLKKSKQGSNEPGALLREDPAIYQYGIPEPSGSSSELLIDSTTQHSSHSTNQPLNHSTNPSPEDL